MFRIQGLEGMILTSRQSKQSALWWRWYWESTVSLGSSLETSKCSGKTRSQNWRFVFYQGHRSIKPLISKQDYTFTPLPQPRGGNTLHPPPWLSVQTCFHHDMRRCLKCACETRCAWFYIGHDHRPFLGQPASPREWETDLEPTRSLNPNPARPATQPTCTGKRDRACCFKPLDWSGFSVAWLEQELMKEHSGSKNTRKIHKLNRHKLIAKQSLSPSVSKECFQKHLSSRFLHLSPQVLSSNKRWRQLLKYQTWAESNYGFKTQTPVERSKKGLLGQKKGKIWNIMSPFHNFQHWAHNTSLVFSSQKLIKDKNSEIYEKQSWNWKRIYLASGSRITFG